MKHYVQVVENTIGRGIADFPGAGAAGGLGAALGGVLKATLKSGIDAVLETVRFDEQLKQVNLVVTGEGRIDGQSVQFGKVPIGVARRCAKANVPVLCICGGRCIWMPPSAFSALCASGRSCTFDRYRRA